MNDYDELEKIAISMVETERLNLGVKFIPISCALLRRFQAENSTDKFWQKLLTKLPKDAKPIRAIENSDKISIIPDITNGAYTDNVLMLFGSEEWEIIKGYAPIPKLILEFDED